MAEDKDDVFIEGVDEEQERSGGSLDVRAVGITAADLRSPNPFLGKRGQIKRANEIMEGTTELLKKTIEYERTRGEALDIDVTIATDSLDRQTQLVRAQARLQEELKKLHPQDEEESEAEALRRELEEVKLGYELDQIKRQREAFSGNAPRKKVGKPKDKVTRMLEEKERWEKEQAQLRAGRVSEGDRLWTLAENEYENRVRKIFESE